MNAYSFQILLTQGIVILLLVVLIIYLLHQKRAIKLARRFESFALLSIKDSEKSIFDHIVSFLWSVIQKISKMLAKSLFLKRYGSRYDKYIKYENKDKISSMDYITIKFFTAIGLVLLSFITAMFQLNSLGFMSILLTFVVGFFLPDLLLYIQFQKKRKQIEDDLLKAIIIMNNSFKSGRNIMQAVEIVKNELEGPISDEFKKIYMDMTYGLSIEVVFERFYNRVKLDDAKYITSSLTMLNRTGGNIVKVFGTIEKSFFNKKKLKQEMESLTSASIFVFRVLCVMPFLFILAIYILNPTYFEPMFTTTLGHILLVLTILFYGLYVLIIKKILEVKM